MFLHKGFDPGSPSIRPSRQFRNWTKTGGLIDKSHMPKQVENATLFLRKTLKVIFCVKGFSFIKNEEGRESLGSLFIKGVS